MESFIGLMSIACALFFVGICIWEMGNKLTSALEKLAPPINGQSKGTS